MFIIGQFENYKTRNRKHIYYQNNISYKKYYQNKYIIKIREYCEFFSMDT